MKRYGRLMITLILPALILSGCRDEEGPLSVTPAVSNIVTFEENNDAGALFTFNRIDDSPLISLQSPTPVDEKETPPGSRVYLRYRPTFGTDGYSSGDIDVVQMSVITSDELRHGNISDYPAWDRDGVWVYSLWRSGTWVNLHCRLAYDESPRRFMLMVDDATRNLDMPHLYLIHEMKEPVNSFGRDYYASFDIGTLWRRKECKGVKIHVANTNLTELTTFTLLKP